MLLNKLNNIDHILLIGNTPFNYLSLNYNLSLNQRITFVQIVICITSLIAYGISPIGFSFTDFKGLVTTINLEKQLISYQIKQNFWIGPAVADLIHLGAKV